MTRHLIDHPRAPQSGRLSQFVRIARALVPNGITRTLLTQRRARTSQRVAAFARLVRSKDA